MPYLFLQGNEIVNVLKPEIVKALSQMKERIVQISLTNHYTLRGAHTLVVTESGKLYAFGAGSQGQLGAKLGKDQTERLNPELVDIDLSC